MAIGVSKAGRAHTDPGTLSRRRRDASGSGGANLNDFGSNGGTLDLGRFGFNAPIPPGGYRWLYADAFSDDGRHGLILIALIGSVFSPYYAWSGRGRPENHCALNVGLYGGGKTRWAMTERKAKAIDRGDDHFIFGPSSVRFEDGKLIFDIAETAAPIPYPVRGQIVIHPEVQQGEQFTLDPNGRHAWRPVWPKARVEAKFDKPGLDWSGDGYVDMNAGLEPLEAGFKSWSWARTAMPDGAAILYDCQPAGGGEYGLALRIHEDGTTEHFDAPPEIALPDVMWGVARPSRSDGAGRVVKTLEDTPFYTRSMIETELLGKTRISMHESLDLKRFDSTWVKCLLPFRMPRAF